MAQVDGQTVKVGDHVSFKQGMEDCGKIWKIEGSLLYISVREYDPSEAYETTEDASRCWIE